MTFFAVATCLSFDEPSKAAKDLLVHEAAEEADAKQRRSGLGGEVAASDLTGAEEFGGEFLFHGMLVEAVCWFFVCAYWMKMNCWVFSREKMRSSMSVRP
jgi:hypothetical protein